jgi:hypothetical protein
MVAAWPDADASGAGWDGVDDAVALGTASAGAASGADCTGRRGAAEGGVAGGGGAVTAGSDALAAGAGVPDLPGAWVVVTVGGGGGAVPTPNRDGDALGEDGSARGAACAACCALVRSATSDSVSFFIASLSGASGLAGTDAMFG